MPLADTSARERFRALALASGHDLHSLDRGEARSALLRVPDFDTLKVLLVRADPADRPARRAAFAGLQARRRLWQGVHDRGEAAIFADAPLRPEDRRAMAPHFPAYVKSVSIPLLQLAAGEVFAPATRADDWDTGEREELYLVVNILRAELAPGARIALAGNVASLLIGDLCVTGTGAAHIAVLPTPHPVDTGIQGALDGPAGAAGWQGSAGRQGQDCRVRPGLFGPQALDLPPLALRDGGDGGPGGDGGAGRRGRTGGASKTTEITIGRFLPGSGPLHVCVSAGRGGDGGAGGAGGPGGVAGVGGRGAPGLTPPESGGQDGQPGRPGRGGAGGNGGRGGIGSPVFVSLPAAQSHLLTTSALPSPGGRGGAGGPGAPPGPDGLAGRGRPPAPVFINGTDAAAPVATLHPLSSQDALP
ncbi:hypothetical protein GEU84_013970 [Fertoebacter nigrum]|uniref:Uncharacterized protein n=1 Tax=Fertoeibacter niger TaxID=2656921 RepID=A0A8X8KQ23_9RHOB|nr:hypothetical protein [Fertoeibacter niger]NUB45501.1 hypothetical protein [Fertoeibacter niger]